jgi:thiamine-monophosphate kinase
MGAQPRWALLAASVPEADDEWVEAFSRGFFACAGRFGLDLIGGDTTRGPLNLTPTVIGEVPAGAALRRSGARDGDDIWVSGAPGLAALGLAHVRGEQVLAPEHAGRCVAALERPQPRVDLGIGLRGLASAAIDVSDGLLADLAHVLEESAVAARLDDPRLPFAAAESCCSDADFARQCVLSGGDDYELAFTGPPRLRAAIEALGRRLSLELWRIGKIVAGTAGELTLIDADGRPVPIGRRGYDHFAA